MAFEKYEFCAGVCERDVDLLLMDRLPKSPGLLNLLKETIADADCGFGFENCEVSSVKHSVMEEAGESDIVLLLNDGARTHAVHIEDKIDALAQDEQPERYSERGTAGCSRGDWDSFSVLIVAPAEYLESNQAAKRYPHQISYEQIMEAIGLEDAFAQGLLATAVSKKESASGWETKNPCVSVTEWYDALLEMCSERGLKPKMAHKKGQVRGQKSGWPTFGKCLNGAAEFIYKSDQGRVELEFAKWAAAETQFKQIVCPLKDEDMHIRKAGKSMCLYVDIEKGIPHDVIDETAIEMFGQALDTVERLYEFAKVLEDQPIEWDVVPID